MLTTTNYIISQDQLERAQLSAPNFNNYESAKVTLNDPIGSFFYDAWTVKPEYRGTVWEEILASLPEHGEARIIKLKEGECYTIHADIDDRWHLNILGENSYLVDLMSKTLYPTLPHTSWMIMNAGVLHSAVNFGNIDRYQLVVRNLLNRNVIANPTNIIISGAVKHRYAFDQIVSPWLNYANKDGKITDFKFVEGVVSFTIDTLFLDEILTLDKIFLNQVGVSLVQQ
jgi:hypothetical protein